MTIQEASAMQTNDDVQERVGRPSSTGWFDRLRTSKALRTGGVVLTLATGCGSSTSNAESSATPNQSSGVPATAPASAKPTASLSLNNTYKEIADRRPYLLLYKDNRGTPSDQKLELGQEVQVECVATNESGMPSAEPGFYRVVMGSLKLYGITNEFANGDPVGQNGYNTLVDPNVPYC